MYRIIIEIHIEVILIKKLLSVILAISVIACFSGCFSVGKTQKDVLADLETETTVDDDYKDINVDTEKNNKYYKEVPIEFGYKSLANQEQKDFYKKLSDSVNEISEEESEENLYPCKLVSFDGVVLTQSEIRLVISAVKIDNPMVFWLSDHFGYSNTYGYTSVQLYSFLSPDEVKEKNNKMMKAANSIVTSIKSGLDDYTLEMKVHNKILEICKYADNVKTSEDDIYAFTPYGVLVNGSAVCEGYAKTFQYLMSQLGINCTTIMGKGKTELHMWNAVEINGKWYHTDVSWDDGADYSKYDYFNVTTDGIETDHKISKTYTECTDDEICGTNGKTAVNFNHSVPKCDATDDNYFVRSTPHFTDVYAYENPEMTDALYDTATKGEGYFHFYIDPMYLEYSNAVDQLFNTGDQLFFRYIDTVNSMSPSNYIDKEQVYIIQKPGLNGVTVKLKYQ